MKAKHRHRARRLALQALYQRHIADTTIAELEKQYLENQTNGRKFDIDYFRELIHAIPKNLEQIDQYIADFSSRPLNQLNPIELVVLRLALYELIHRLDIPYRVVINEALELNKTFGTEEGYRFVNGVLDKAASQIRTSE